MKKLKKLFIHNKVWFVLIMILIICFILIIYGLFKYFYVGINKDTYGDRLEGISDYKLDKNIKSNLQDVYKDNDNVGDATLDLKGKIIYISIDFVKATKIEDARSLALKSLDIFSDEEKQFYDIQYILTANTISEDEFYPTMGYKNSSSQIVAWINN